MAQFGQAQPYIGGLLRWADDDTSCAHYPALGDATASLGTGGASPKRALVNDGYVRSQLFHTSAAAAAVASSVAETTIIGTKVGPNYPGASAAGTIPAGYLNRAGAGLRAVVTGIIGNTGTPTITIKVKLGSTVILTSGALTMATITGPLPFRFDATGFVVTTGATGTILMQGQFIHGLTGPTGAVLNAYTAAAVTVDLTASQALDVTIQWGTSSASNTITGQVAFAEYW